MNTNSMGKQLAENKIYHDSRRNERVIKFYHQAVELAAALRSQEVEYQDSLPAIHAADGLVRELEKLLPAE